VIKPLPEVNAYLEQKGTNAIDNGMLLDQLLRRAELDYDAWRSWRPAPWRCRRAWPGKWKSKSNTRATSSANCPKSSASSTWNRSVARDFD
jgi:hypothetical protein